MNIIYICDYCQPHQAHSHRVCADRRSRRARAGREIEPLYDPWKASPRATISPRPSGVHCTGTSPAASSGIDVRASVPSPIQPSYVCPREIASSPVFEIERRRASGNDRGGTSLAVRTPQTASPLEQHASAFQFCTTHVNSVRRRTIEHAPARPLDHRPVAQCRVARHRRGRPDRRPDSCVRETVGAEQAIEDGVHPAGDRNW